MKTELVRLDEQLKRTLEGAAWHGPSVLEVLDGVSAHQAAAHPIAGAHSIWELVLHLYSDYDLVLRRLGGDGRRLTEAEDWPPVPEPSAETWAESVRALKQRNAELRRAVRGFPSERLDEPLVAEAAYTAYTQFIGVTQHALYHTGQMALLKKALAAADAAELAVASDVAHTGAQPSPSSASKRERLSTIGQPVPELPVQDVERAQQYYRETLGFDIGWLHPGKEIGAVSRGDVVIFFRRTEPPFAGAVHWVFAEDLDASYGELTSSGANIVEPLEKKPWGLRQFAIDDLDGNRFYFHHD